MRLFTIFLGIVLFVPSGIAQKFLQIEKVNSLKVKKFYVGDELTFQLKDDREYWRTEVIENILVNENILIFPKGMVRLGDITAIRTFTSKAFGDKSALSLYTFGAGWVLYSLVDAMLGGTLTWSVAIVSGTALVSGFILQQIFKHRTYRIGKRRRLRLLDLTFKNEFGP